MLLSLDTCQVSVVAPSFCTAAICWNSTDNTTQAIGKDGVWAYSEPDWDELKWVVTGHGPETARRLGFRQASREETAWVRRAVLADAA